MEEIEINIPATKRGLLNALARIEEFRAARNLSAERIARVCVIAEELITNTIKYGHHGECDQPIRLCLRAGEVLTMIYEDQAPRFDPVLWRREEALASPDREGRAGVDLILGLSSSVAHEGGPQWNRLTLTFASDGGGAKPDRPARD